MEKGHFKKQGKPLKKKKWRKKGHFKKNGEKSNIKNGKKAIKKREKMSNISLKVFESKKTHIKT